MGSAVGSAIWSYTVEPKTVVICPENIYFKGKEVPAGFKKVRFGPPVKGDFYLPVCGVGAEMAFETFSRDAPRWILVKVEVEDEEVKPKELVLVPVRFGKRRWSKTTYCRKTTGDLALERGEWHPPEEWVWQEKD